MIDPTTINVETGEFTTCERQMIDVRKLRRMSTVLCWTIAALVVMCIAIPIGMCLKRGPVESVSELKHEVDAIREQVEEIRTQVYFGD